MKTLLFFLSGLLILTSFNNMTTKDQLQGAWHLANGNEEQVLLFQDGYFTHTTYNQKDRKFIQTRGGHYQMKDKGVVVKIDFDTQDKEKVGLSETYSFNIENNQLSIDLNGQKGRWKQIDNGSAPLAGVWRITERMQNGQLTPIHQTGTRQTLKILTGNRFQWAAIDPGKKEFHGTGGGTYTFANGKYTEHIEFFSRDSSRIGASLSFDDKLENGRWHHTGLSSRGEKIYEVWEKLK